jgi:hypothetical protein
MKLIAQITTLIGILISGAYAYINNYAFEGVVALLSFLAVFSATFFFSNKKEMSQTTGDNSKAYQSGRDINIKD